MVLTYIQNGSPSISPAKKSKKQKTSGEVFRPYVPKEEVTEGSGIASTSKGKSDDIPLSNNVRQKCEALQIAQIDDTP